MSKLNDYKRKILFNFFYDEIKILKSFFYLSFILLCINIYFCTYAIGGQIGEIRNRGGGAPFSLAYQNSSENSLITSSSAPYGLLLFDGTQVEQLEENIIDSDNEQWVKVKFVKKTPIDFHAQISVWEPEIYVPQLHSFPYFYVKFDETTFDETNHPNEEKIEEINVKKPSPRLESVKNMEPKISTVEYSDDE